MRISTVQAKHASRGILLTQVDHTDARDIWHEELPTVSGAHHVYSFYLLYGYFTSIRHSQLNLRVRKLIQSTSLDYNLQLDSGA